MGKREIKSFVQTKVQLVRRFYAEHRKLFFVYTGGGLLLLSYVAITTTQLLYSPDKAAYGARLGAQSVQGKSSEEIKAIASDLYQKTTFRVMAEGSELVAITAPQLDNSFNSSEIASEVMKYDIAERFIPLSLWLKRPSVSNISVNASVEGVRAALSEKLGDKSEVDPVNATLSISDDAKVTITPEKKGAKVDVDQLSSLFTAANAPLGGTVDYSSTTEMIPATITVESLSGVQKKAQVIVNRAAQLTVGDERFPIEPKEFGSWVTFTYNDGTAQLAVDGEKLSATVNQKVGSKVNVAAGKSTATLYDGNEVSRVEGARGRAINYQAIVAALTQTFATDGNTTPNLSVESIPVAPTVTYVYTYSKTQVGLQAYLRQLGAESDIRVSVRQLSGAGWSADARSDEQSVSASTYKLFVAIYLLREIASGGISYTDEVNGSTVRACMEKMIVNSDNACAEAFLEKYGATKMNNALWALGFTRSTSFTSSDGLAKTTTADLNKALQGIEQGTMVAGEGRAYLLDLMGRQVYRSGVPAGTSANVRDKVGFLSGYLNDAAIVYHPRGTYVISIITKGQTWGKIAEVTRQVESLMYP